MKNDDLGVKPKTRLLHELESLRERKGELVKDEWLHWKAPGSFSTG